MLFFVPDPIFFLLQNWPPECDSYVTYANTLRFNGKCHLFYVKTSVRLLSNERGAKFCHVTSFLMKKTTVDWCIDNNLHCSITQKKYLEGEYRWINQKLWPSTEKVSKLRIWSYMYHGKLLENCQNNTKTSKNA